MSLLNFRVHCIQKLISHNCTPLRFSTSVLLEPENVWIWQMADRGTGYKQGPVVLLYSSRAVNGYIALECACRNISWERNFATSSSSLSSENFNFAKQAIYYTRGGTCMSIWCLPISTLEESVSLQNCPHQSKIKSLINHGTFKKAVFAWMFSYLGFDLSSFSFVTHFLVMCCGCNWFTTALASAITIAQAIRYRSSSWIRQA